MNQPRTLNQYNGSDAQSNIITIVAPDMETACRVYRDQQEMDPVQMQRVKQNIMCVLPENIVTFTAVAYCATGTPTGCSVTPEQYTIIAGSKLVFTAKEGEGFQFSKWLINGVEVTDESGAVITDKVALLTIPSGNNTCEIKAVFVTV
jgi:hypothetical protein